jgi:hypothetical protein
MKKLLIGMLLLGGVIAVIAVIARRRSGSTVDEWDSFAADTYGRTSDSVTKATDAATESISQVADAAKGSVSEATDAAQTSASKAAEAAKKA